MAVPRLAARPDGELQARGTMSRPWWKRAFMVLLISALLLLVG
jgi:hypothetical protein